MRYFFLLVVLLCIASFPAQAASPSIATFAECNLSGIATNGIAACPNLLAPGGTTAFAVKGNSNGSPVVCKAPTYCGAFAHGTAIAPIDAWGACRWLNNSSSYTSYLVQFATSTQWGGFLRAPPAGITMTGCAEPQSETHAASPLSTVATYDSTCAGATPADGTIAVPNVYGRTGISVYPYPPVSQNFTCHDGATKITSLLQWKAGNINWTPNFVYSTDLTLTASEASDPQNFDPKNITIENGAKVNLTWQASDTASTCTAASTIWQINPTTGTATSSSGSLNQTGLAASGTLSVSPTAGTTTYTLACTGENGLTSTAAVTVSTNAAGTPTLNSSVGEQISDEGLWVHAPNQNGYYAYNASLMRDNNGRMHMTYCSSGQAFNPTYAPDWRSTTITAPDEIRYQYSDDNGHTWSPAKAIIYPRSNGVEEDVTQDACTSSLVYYKGYYYLYFESPYEDMPSHLLAIEVARSLSPAGPYQVWTDSGWQALPTTAPWKPVLKPAITLISGGEAYANAHLADPNSTQDSIWGVGIPRVTEKNGTLYLYYTDATYNYGTVVNGNFQYIPDPTNQTAHVYQMVAQSTNPTSFPNVLGNQLKDSSGNPLWFQSEVKYVPSTNTFIGFLNEENGASSRMIYRTSSDGYTWSNESVVGNLPSQYQAITTGQPQDGYMYTSFYVSPLTDMYGDLNLSDLYFAFFKNYVLPDAPVAFQGASYEWYYGGNDIYGVKVF